MIDRLGRIAVTVQRARWLWLLLVAASLMIVAASAVSNPWLADDRWLMPGVVALCWSLTLLSFGRLFESVPPRATRDMAWRRRLARGMQRGLLRVLGLAMLGLSAAVLVLTWQLLRVWYMG